jgi:hypothetical protein
MILLGIVKKENYWGRFFISAEGEMVAPTWSLILRKVFFDEKALVCVFILVLTVSVLLNIFCIYNVYLFTNGMTTNETIKHANNKKDL